MGPARAGFELERHGDHQGGPPADPPRALPLHTASDLHGNAGGASGDGGHSAARDRAPGFRGGLFGVVAKGQARRVVSVRGVRGVVRRTPPAYRHVFAAVLVKGKENPLRRNARRLVRGSSRSRTWRGPTKLPSAWSACEPAQPL